MKVYLVSRGSYSDYNVAGIFSSEEKANKYMDLVPTYDGWNGLEEMELDGLLENFDSIKGFFYRVGFATDGSGQVHNPNDSIWIEERDVTERIEHDKYDDGGIEVDVYLWAKDTETALKVASERRAIYLANLNGI